MSLLAAQQKNQFRSRLLFWYCRSRQDLPWRHTRDPYNILVSEIMLQQTQVNRVIVKWPEFLRQFPTLESLARSPISSVIQAWSGMGYNRRALYLQRTCQEVLQRYRGRFPSQIEDLKSLSGIGEYTARALLVFAFGKSLIAPDVNVLRVLERSFISVPSPLEERVGVRRMSEKDRIKKLIEIGDELVTPQNAYDINQALMDLGRTVCTAKNPKDIVCPLHHYHRNGDVSQRRHQRMEPMFAGVPRRIWRGRVVELIRSMKKISVHRLLHHLGIREESQNQQWLTSVLRQLQRDGLVVLIKGIVTLP